MVILINATHIMRSGTWYEAILHAITTFSSEPLAKSFRDGIPLSLEIYAQIPNSARPEPPIVIGIVDTTVDAEVANNDSNRPILNPTAFASTIKEIP